MISYLIIKALIESLQDEAYAECALEVMLLFGALFLDICFLPIEIIAALVVFVIFIIKNLANKKEK